MLNEDELREITLHAMIAAYLAVDRAIAITGEDPMVAADRAIADVLQPDGGPVA